MSEFAGAAKKPGIEVWRIEKLVPTPVPTKMYGQFYDGDAYIVCKTAQRPSSSSFDIDIFFWLGENSSTDEQGVAAYKTVELDESLGGGPTQHREVQGYESDFFMQQFKKVEYLKGGVASGFKHVERDSHEPRLLHLKGARSVRVMEVPLKSSSLNAGDVFVLDLGKKLMQWNGSEANKKEKAKALDVCLGIKDDERGGKASIDAFNQGAEPDDFWKALGGKGPVAPPTHDDLEKSAKGIPTLFKVSDASGTVTTTEISKGDLKKSMMDSNDVFLLDNHAEIFVWVGKGASETERKKGMTIGSDYCAQGGRPKGTKVTKVMEGTEPTVFKSNFSEWKQPAAVSVGVPTSGNVAQSGSMSGEDAVAALGDVARLQKEKEAEIDDGNGTLDMYRIEDFKPVKVPEDLEGNFYAGDSYIVKYIYQKNGKDQYILYYWLGSKSSQDEKGAAAICTTTMDDEEFGGAATQVRVVMGKEPSHFIRCFAPSPKRPSAKPMIIHSGGKASGFKNRADADSYDMDGVSLFHIRGNDKDDTRAVQVPEAASSLNAGDCFVLQTPTVVYFWKGQKALEVEAETAKIVAETLQSTRTFEALEEGAEPDAFWAALGGKGDYPQAKDVPATSLEPMLFQCSNSTGALTIDPVFDFSQADLTEEDVFLLDSFTTVFVWIGSEANAVEKAGAKEAAGAYIKQNGYEADTPVITIKSGSEPAIFTCNFLGWDAAAKTKFVDPYEAKLAALKAANPADDEPAAAADISDAPSPRKSVGGGEIFDKDFKEPGSDYTLNYAELTKPLDQLPSGVDPRKKEQYLSDGDFVKYLNSPRGEFEKLKPWKQQQLKKAAGLF